MNSDPLSLIGVKRTRSPSPLGAVLQNVKQARGPESTSVNTNPTLPTTSGPISNFGPEVSNDSTPSSSSSSTQSQSKFSNDSFPLRAESSQSSLETPTNHTVNPSFGSSSTPTSSFTPMFNSSETGTATNGTAASRSKSRQPSTTELASALGVSSKPRERRKWTEEEDTKLRTLVAEWGDQRGKNSNWDKISESMEGRSSKDCRKRWFHSLDPTLRRGRWTPDEDRMLIEAYESMGPSWNRISQLITGRTDDQCSKRYNDVLDPRIKTRLREWTKEEDAMLMQLFKEEGPQWKIIASKMDGRTGLTCRNRWRKLASSSVGPSSTSNSQQSQNPATRNSFEPQRTSNSTNNSQSQDTQDTQPLSPESEQASSNHSTPSSVHSNVSASAVPPPPFHNSGKASNTTAIANTDNSNTINVSYSNKSQFTTNSNQSTNNNNNRNASSTLTSGYLNTSSGYSGPETLLERSLSILQGSEATAFLQNVSNFAAETEAAVAAAALPAVNSRVSGSSSSAGANNRTDPGVRSSMSIPQANTGGGATNIVSPRNSTSATSTKSTHYSFGLDQSSGVLAQKPSYEGSSSLVSSTKDCNDDKTMALRQEDIERIVMTAKRLGVAVIVHQHNHHKHENHHHHHYYNGDARAEGANSVDGPTSGANNRVHSTAAVNNNNKNNDNNNDDGSTPPFLQAHPEFRELEQMDMDTDPFGWFGTPFPSANVSNGITGPTLTGGVSSGHGGYSNSGHNSGPNGSNYGSSMMTSYSGKGPSPNHYEDIPFNPS